MELKISYSVIFFHLADTIVTVQNPYRILFLMLFIFAMKPKKFHLNSIISAENHLLTVTVLLSLLYPLLPERMMHIHIVVDELENSAKYFW